MRSEDWQVGRPVVATRVSAAGGHTEAEFAEIGGVLLQSDRSRAKCVTCCQIVERLAAGAVVIKCGAYLDSATSWSTCVTSVRT